MKTLPRLTSFFLLLTLIVFSCKKSDSTSGKVLTNSEARNYFSAYTHGMIHENDNIEFRLLEPLSLDSNAIKGAIKLMPTFDYHIQLREDQKGFIIHPKQNLERGMEYTVKIQVNKVLPIKDKKILISELKVFEQFIDIQREGLIINPDNKSYVRVKVNTSISEKEENIKPLFDYDPNKIEVEQISDKEYLVDLSFDPKDGKKKIAWSGNSISSKEEGVIDIWSFDKDEFNVINTYFNRNTNEYQVYFTKILDQNQDAKGLIRIGKEVGEYQIYNNQLTVQIKTKTKQDMDLTISQGLLAKDGSKLPLDLKYKIEIAMVKPELEWITNGTYIPHTGEFKLPFKAKALKSVVATVVGIPSINASRFVAWNSMSYMDQIEMIRFGQLIHKSTYDLDNLTSNNLESWNEFGIDFTEAFQREKGMIYYIELSFGPSNTLLACDDPELYDFEQKTIEDSWFDDRNRYYRYYGYYDYREQNNPCHSAYYLSRPNITTMIHCTNVFPIIKKGEKQVHVAVKELLDNDNASGAQVDLINLQGSEIASETVSNNGVCSFTNLNRDAKALRITYEGEVSYFNLQDGSENPITEFDVSSNVRDVNNKIFVYSERDVRRPGDTIFLNIMLNRAKFHFEKDLPIVVRLKNPKNVLYEKQVVNIKEDQSIYSFKMPTQLESPTGYWTADIEVGPLKKYKTIRVETIKPNVVDLVYQFNNEDENWILNAQINGNLEVEYLAGYPMKEGKVSAAINIIPISNPFENHNNFTFQPLVRPQSVTDLKTWSIKTNDQGTASFKLNHDFKKYKGVSKVIIDSQIDLPGGGLNTETESRLISPFNSYVGIQKGRGKGWRGSYRFGETPQFDIISVDSKGTISKKNKKVRIELFQYKKDWWYDRYRMTSGHRSHSSHRYDKISSEEINLRNGKGIYTHDTKKNKSGMYKLVVTDLESNHISEYQFHSIVETNYAVNNNPVFFDLELDKEVYDQGETMDIKFPNIPDAKALVSVERGSDVLEFFWYDISKGDLIMPIQDDWFPNVYLNVSIVQNYGQENNDRPLRLYTVKKIKINQNDGQLQPVVKADDKVAPNQSYEFEISEKSGKEIEYTIAVVDRGLLNLTGFKTPDPYNHFSKMISLKIKTWDIFDQLLYFMNPSFAGVFSIGGDESNEKLLDESADFNRFEPVVFHLGPFKLGPNKTGKHKIDLPNYIGSLKMMVVASNKASYGNASKNIKVVSPLMIQSQLPRSLNVGDVVDIPITLFKDDDKIKEVKVMAQSSNDIINFEKNSVSTSLQNLDQTTTALRFKTGMESGTAEISLEASGSKHKAQEQTKLFVNYPNSYSEKSEVVVVKPNEEHTIDIESFGFEKTKHVDLQVSGALVPNFSQHYSSLISYPYGCLEQTTSRAIGMLFIQDLMAMDPKEKLERKDNLDAAITRINAFQQKDGRFNYWKNGYYHHWSDLYAGHFLIEAKEKNVSLNNDALNLWIKNKQRQANQWEVQGTASNYLKNKEELLQAYRLFLLAKAGKPAKSAMNRFRKRTLESRMSNILLAGAYHYTGMKEISENLLNSALQEGKSDRYNNYSFGSPIRNKALVIYIMSMIKKGPNLDRLYKDWVEEINAKSWLSTQDKGFAFMACAEYFGKTQNIGETIDFEISSDKFNVREKISFNTQQKYTWDWDEIGGKAIVKNNSNSDLYIFKTERAIDKELYAEPQSNGLDLSVKYTNGNGEAINKSSVNHGEEITISITIKNTDILDQDNLALTFKAPSGWEILNPRLYQTNVDESASYTYQDFRDDKVYTFFNLVKNGSTVFKFRAKANLTGEYYLPSVRCEHMYDGDIYAQNKASRIIIK